MEYSSIILFNGVGVVYMTDKMKLRNIELSIEQIKDSIADINTKLLSLQNQPIIIQAKDHFEVYEKMQKMFTEHGASPLRPLIIFPYDDARVTDTLMVGINNINKELDEPKPCRDCGKLTDPVTRYVEVQYENGQPIAIHYYCGEACKDTFYMCQWTDE